MVRICFAILALLVFLVPSKSQTNNNLHSDPSDARMRYGLSIRDLVDKSKKYPPSANARGEMGLVVVAMTIDAKGQLLDNRIVKPSCFPEINAEALAAVERAKSLFPPFPSGIDHSYLTFNLPIVFARSPEVAQKVAREAACNDQKPPPPLLSPPPPSPLLKPPPS